MLSLSVCLRSFQRAPTLTGCELTQGESLDWENEARLRKEGEHDSNNMSDDERNEDIGQLGKIPDKLLEASRFNDRCACKGCLLNLTTIY